MAAYLVRGVALIYVLAYAVRLRWWRSLYSSVGLTPVPLRLETLRRWQANKKRPGPAWLFTPSILWLAHSDAFLQSLHISGFACAIFALCGVQPLPMLGVCGLIYASLISVLRDYLATGGDLVLTNLGTFAMFCWLISPDTASADTLYVALTRLMYLQMMLWSGLSKILVGDPGWRRLIAMDYHYWAQPLPTRLGFLLNRMPHAFHAASVVISLLIEIVCPIFAMWNGWARLVAFFLCNGLIAAINSAGNLGLFGGTVYAASLSLLDRPLIDDLLAWRSGALTNAALWSNMQRFDADWIVQLGTARQALLVAYVIFYTVFLLHKEGTDTPFRLTMRLIDRSRLCTALSFWPISLKRRVQPVLEGRRKGSDVWHEVHVKHSIDRVDGLAPMWFGTHTRFSVTP